MKRLNVKFWMIAAFWLIVFTNSMQAQEDLNKPNEVTKVESEETTKIEAEDTDLAKQKNRLELQKQLMIKKWRRLRPGMSEVDVRKILGRPKLIQSGSHTCEWYYQYLPTPNSTSVNGTVVFTAKSLDTLIGEETLKLWKKLGSLMGEENLERWKEGKEIRHSQVDTGHRVQPYYVRPPKNNVERNRRGNLEVQSRMHNFEVGLGESFNRQAQIATEAQELTAEQNYNKAVRKLTYMPRSPVLMAKSIIEPDWNYVEFLLAKIENKKSEVRPIDKWESRNKWKILKINMKQKKVQALLGEAERTEIAVGGRIEYYGNIDGFGELYFEARSDLEEYLVSWTEPFWPVVEEILQEENVQIEEIVLQEENLEHDAPYAVLRSWELYNQPNSLGLDILLENDLNREQIVLLIKELSQGKDPVIISIYTNRTIYTNAKNDIYGEGYKEHFLLVYLKNTTVPERGFYGLNEIRWMQETGKFSHLYGKKTQL